MYGDQNDWSSVEYLSANFAKPTLIDSSRVIRPKGSRPSQYSEPPLVPRSPALGNPQQVEDRNWIKPKSKKVWFIAFAVITGLSVGIWKWRKR
jgi:hypothetical protein